MSTPRLSAIQVPWNIKFIESFQIFTGIYLLIFYKYIVKGGLDIGLGLDKKWAVVGLVSKIMAPLFVLG